jgi:hypothetical protein
MLKGFQASAFQNTAFQVQQVIIATVDLITTVRTIPTLITSSQHQISAVTTNRQITTTTQITS